MSSGATARATVLVTGASGLIGGEVTVRLLEAGYAVVALLHDNGDLVRNDGSRLVAPAGRLSRWTGDVTVPGLGLARSGAPSPLAGVDLVVHTAAITDFGRPGDVYRAVNLTGTANVLAAVRRARVPLVHVSTAYVCGERDGRIREDSLDVGQRFGNPYEESKFAAEMLVRQAAAEGLPVAVVRPSVVAGAEATGEIRDFKNMYPVLRLITDGRVRTVPGHYDAAIDLVPVDYVADVIVETVTRFDDAVGTTVHAVGGALTLRDFSDVLAQYPSFHVPRFVPPNGFDAARLPTSEQGYYRKVVALYESYFRRRVRFEDGCARAFVSRARVAGGQPYLCRLLDHCVKVGYLGAPLPSVAEVLAGLDRKAN